MNLHARRVTKAAEWGRLLALSLVWGDSLSSVAVAVNALPPFAIVAARVSIAAALPRFAALLEAPWQLPAASAARDFAASA